MSDDIKYNPPWMKVLNGEKLTFSEWFQFYVSAPLNAYRTQSKITPALRERCVRYAIDGGAQTAHDINREAQRIAEYITGASDR